MELLSNQERRNKGASLKKTATYMDTEKMNIIEGIPGDKDVHSEKPEILTEQQKQAGSTFNMEDQSITKEEDLDKRKDDNMQIKEYDMTTQKVENEGKEMSDTSLKHQQQVYNQYGQQLNISVSPERAGRTEAYTHANMILNNSVDQNNTFSPAERMISPKFTEFSNNKQVQAKRDSIFENSQVQSNVRQSPSPVNLHPKQHIELFNNHTLLQNSTEKTSPQGESKSQSFVQTHALSKLTQHQLRNKQLIYTHQMDSNKNSNLSYTTHQFEPPMLSNKNHRRLYSADVSKAQSKADIRQKQASGLRGSVQTQIKMNDLQNSLQKTMTHNQRIQKLANQKLTELLKFDESSQTFKLIQPSKQRKTVEKSGTGQIGQYLDKHIGLHQRASSKNMSRFTTHVSRRNDNFQKQQVVYHRQYNEERNRSKYANSGGQMPMHMSRSSISKMLNPNSFKLDGASDRRGSSQTQVLSTGKTDTRKDGQSDYNDAQKANILLQHAKVNHESQGELHQHGNSFSFSQKQSLKNIILNDTSYTNFESHFKNNSQSQNQSTQLVIRPSSAKVVNLQKHIKEQKQKSSDKQASQVYLRYLPSQASQDIITETAGLQDVSNPGMMHEVKRQIYVEKSPYRVDGKVSRTDASFAKKASSPVAGMTQKDELAYKALQDGMNYKRRGKSPGAAIERVDGLDYDQMCQLYKMSQQYLDGKDNAQLIDPALIDDDLNYKPNTDFSVTLNFKKEFIRHKQVICSIKEFNNYDIQNVWDIGYSKAFCNYGKNSSGQNNKGVNENARLNFKMIEKEHEMRIDKNPQLQTEFEQKVDLINKNSYFENYQLEDEIKDSVGKMILGLGQTQAGGEMHFLNQESTLYNTHTKELIEGYLQHTNEAGISYADFEDKMVLRFKNQHEISLYFEIVDQLSQVLILKGNRILLEKEHYGQIMEKFIKLNKNFLLFLCKDEDYGNFMDAEGGAEQEVETKSPSPTPEKKANSEQKDYDKYIQNREKRFIKRDNDHRSFIKAFMFDYIFKTFIQVLDECINQREKELHEKKEEWVYFSEKRCNNLESEAQTMMKQIAKLRVQHKEDCAKYEQRIEKLKEEQRDLQMYIQEYKTELFNLKNYDVRTDEVGKLRKSIKETNELLDVAEREMSKQRDSVIPVINMINVIAHEPKFKDAELQTDCQIGCHNAHVITQVEGKQLANYAETSLMKLQGVISQVRVAAEEEDEDLDGTSKQNESSRKAKKGSKSSNRKAGKKGSKIYKKLGAKKRDEMTQADKLQEHDEAPMDFDQFKLEMNGYMDSFGYNKLKNLSDFICFKILDNHREDQGVIEASFKLDKYLKVMQDDQYQNDPLVLLISKMLGLNGHKQMNQGQLTYFIELREAMRKDAGLQNGDEIMLSKSIEFINRHFKGNRHLHKTLLSKLYLHTTKEKLAYVDLPPVNIIIDRNSFDFPSQMNENSQRSFFAKMMRDEPQYFWKLSLIFFNILIQLRLKKKDIQQIFRPEDKEEGVRTPTKADFISILKDNVVITKSELRLLWTFIDPYEQSYQPKWEADLSHFINTCKANQTWAALKQKVSQSTLLNFFYDEFQIYLYTELPYQIEECVRRVFKLNVQTFNMDILMEESMIAEANEEAELDKTGREPGEEGTEKKRKKSTAKKKEKKKKEGLVEYHSDFELLQKCYNIIVDNSNIKEQQQAQMAGLATGGPRLQKSASQAGSPSPGARRSQLNSYGSGDGAMKVYSLQEEQVCMAQLFLELASQFDVSKPINIQFEADPLFAPFGSSFINSYQSYDSVMQTNDFLQLRYNVEKEEKKVKKESKKKK